VIPSFVQIALYAILLAVCVRPLGLAMSAVMSGQLTQRWSLCASFERHWFRLIGIDSKSEMTWRQYSIAVIAFSACSFVFVYLIQRCQTWLPFNPESLPNVSSDSAFNTAVSFVTNTNWQGYGGETTMSYLTQALALGSQNFLSAAVGLSVLVAFVRSFVRTDALTIGNFYVDMTRSVFWILLPLSVLLAIALVSQGVVQTWSAYPKAASYEVAVANPDSNQSGSIAVGPAASQIAIKQLGTNGGGYFNANSAHPFENPTPLSNLLQMLAILLLPASLCVTFGDLVCDRRQGWAMLAAMSLILVPLVVMEVWLEMRGNPQLAAIADQSISNLQPGGNMEGKEVRFGIANSSLWAVATTAASNGSVNAMHDSFTPLGGLIPMWLIQLGEVVFGGVGSGLYGMIIFALITVFISGLMVGRTPEYLGKKIGAFEIKMASLAILLPCASVLLGTALAVSIESGVASVLNPGAHGFSEILYALSSASNNNGSAFAGLSANTPFYNGLLGIAMFVGRFGVLLPVLAIAGSLARKKRVPQSTGTLPTHTPLFVGLLVCIVILVGALSFFPALALGPIVEAMQLSNA
jgi:potassium-transporting ATPase potassium-binding subunit